MSTDHFPNTVFAISRLNATFRGTSVGGRIDAVSETSWLKRDAVSAKSSNFAATSERPAESRQRVFRRPLEESVGSTRRWNQPRLSPAANAEETRARDTPTRRLSSIGSFAAASSTIASASIVRTRSAKSSAPYEGDFRDPVRSDFGSKSTGCCDAYHQPAPEAIRGR